MATTTTNIRETLFLSEWIRRAIDGVDLSALAATNKLLPATSFGADPSQWPANVLKSTALCSDDYLLSALRVARSLADQICKSEDIAAKNRGGDENDGNESNIIEFPFLPPLGSSWAESVLVHLSTKNDGEIISPSPFCIEDAEFLVAAEEGRLEDGMQRIYSLGVVFYEIFSGGERPAELTKQKQEEEEKPYGSQTKTEEPSQELSENLDPLPFDQVVPLTDLAGVLSILDDNDEDELNRQDSPPVDQVGPIDLGPFISRIFDDVPIPDECNVQDVCNLAQNHRKKRMQSSEYNMRVVSVQPLEAIGIPRSLCDLIANMMDCANGARSGEDAYQSMSQVRSDLQLLLDKPAIYLRDQDMGRFSTTGLQQSETMFGRTAELSTIMDAYRRSVSGDSESVTIFGPPGSGKSTLAHEAGKHVVAEGGFFLYGKFDRLEQGKPLSALATAFDQFCGTMLQNDWLCEFRQQLACQVRTELGREAFHLTKIIPNLAIILGPEPPDFNHDDDCGNAQKRFQYLLCRFVEVISATSRMPLTLCLDDLQWADSASIAAVNQLLSTGCLSQKIPFFFLGCYREGEVDNCNPMWEVMCNADLLNAGYTKVTLGYMDEETVNTIVSETLRLLPRLTRSLSGVIYHKTKGNPLFVSRLILSLSKEGLLHPSLSRRRWEWDSDRIQNQKLPDDVAMFLTHSIGVLPEDVKSSLCVLSCFGSSVESALIKVLERGLDKKFLDNLDVAVAEGFLDKINDQYRFSHDRIQEAAYNMIYQVRCLFHFQCGMALSSLCVGNGVEGDGLLLTAVNQLNLGGPQALQDHGQIDIVASLNLRAGKKAIEMSDFQTAYSYFDHGITFLRMKHWHWTELYELSLELFNSAAKCALFKGDYASFLLLSQHVVKNARSFEDKLNVAYFSMCAMASTSSLPESIEKGLDVLSNLGIVLRGCDSSMETCVQETKNLLSGHTDDKILNTRRVTDPTMIMAMKFLGKLVLGMTQIIPKSVSFVTQKIIQLSLSHGLSPVSPIGFVHFGSFMAKLGDISGGYRYVKLAFSLLDKIGSRESAGEVICVGTHVRAYVEPLQATIAYYDDGYAAAMTSGDVNIASLNRLCFYSGSFFAGVNLQILRKKCDETQKMMAERRQAIFYIQLQQVKRSLFKLIGVEEEPKYDISEEQSILATNNSVLKSYWFHKAYISFMFRSYDDAKECAEKFLAYRDNAWANMLLVDSVHAFYIGLASFWLARRSREEQQQWNQRGNESKLALKRWAESSQWTFENKWYLLEAEESYCNNDFEAAKSLYGIAISSVKNHKFVNEEALTYELAGYFYLEMGETEQSKEHLLNANEKYKEWGAFEKSNSLIKFMQNMSSVNMNSTDRLWKSA